MQTKTKALRGAQEKKQRPAIRQQRQKERPLDGGSGAEGALELQEGLVGQLGQELVAPYRSQSACRHGICIGI